MDVSGRPTVTLDSLPDELIHLLLHHLPPEDTLMSFALTSQRFHRLADEPLLWRHHCHSSFHYWDFSHEFPLQNTLPAPEVDWKGLFIIRNRPPLFSQKSSLHVLIDWITWSVSLRWGTMSRSF
jgi:hypothetical protein